MSSIHGNLVRKINNSEQRQSHAWPHRSLVTKGWHHRKKNYSDVWYQYSAEFKCIHLAIANATGVKHTCCICGSCRCSSRIRKRGCLIKVEYKPEGVTVNKCTLIWSHQRSHCSETDVPISVTHDDERATNGKKKASTGNYTVVWMVQRSTTWTLAPQICRQRQALHNNDRRRQNMSTL